ncbi:MAG: pteridine-dependent deoxygenase [Pseudomonadota bacterium]|nr:pteridine-dependent deoxygenase [Pseudomonadota bacterium]
MQPELRHPHLQVDYVEAGDPAVWLAKPDVLAAFGFGADAPQIDNPRWLNVPLDLHGEARLEIWRAHTPVAHGRDGDVQWASDDELLFGAINVAETGDGILAAARHAYTRMSAHVAAQGFPHMLRIWNYFDAITVGEGDTERYREFCVGRAEGLGNFSTDLLPAATAIGRSDAARVLQVYWLAAKAAGRPVENPRQVSAYRYPRQYGPQSPSFARAMLPPTLNQTPLLLSGTAAVVGHASQHAGELLKQIDETFNNFDALLTAARQRQPELPPSFGAGTRLKVYVRDAADLPLVERALAARLGNSVPHIILHAAICRRELAIEIDGVHG